MVPFRVQALRGTKSNQAVNVLALKQQSGTQNTWSTYVELAGGSADTIFKTQFDFAAIGSLITSASQVVSLTLQLNTVGVPYARQRRVYKLKNFASGAWTTIGSNRNAPDWTWFSQSLVISNPTAYYKDKGTGPALSLQIVSNNKADVVDVDYLVMNLVYSDNAAPVAAPVASPTKAPTSATTWWKPKASDNLTWQLQFQGVINTNIQADIFDIDLFYAIKNGTVIQTLHDQGKKVVCYFSAGTYESWNSDWHQFFPFVTAGVDYTGTRAPFAHPMADWAGERWLDVSRIDLLTPIMTHRMKLAKNAGCDAVDPDNMDGFANRQEAGLPNLTAAHQLAYNRKIADIAHSFGLGVGLKNDLAQLGKLLDWYDFAINEQCFYYNECGMYTNTFIAADKPVFGVEYEGDTAVFCPEAKNLKLSTIFKKLALTAYRVGCENVV